MTPEQLAEKLLNLVSDGRPSRTETVQAMVEVIATYDPVTEIMLDERFGTFDEDTAWMLCPTDNEFTVFEVNIYGPKRRVAVVHIGKTALEACQNVVKQEETT